MIRRYRGDAESGIASSANSTRENRSGRTAGTLLWLVAILSIPMLVIAQDDRVRQKTYVMPRVTPQEFVDEGVGIVKEAESKLANAVAKRGELYDGISTVFGEFHKWEDRVAEIYPKNQLEWLLITDEVADTLTEAIGPLLAGYQEHHPDEVLTQGRQLFELAMMQIVGPPPRMLGFHVLMLGDYAYAKGDSLLLTGQTDDVDGVTDGVLRNLRDWCHFYDQVHDTELSIYESRLIQEDWIIARLEDNCGGKRWKVTQQYMAMVGVDSTKTPPEDRFAHEFHLAADGCDDSRVVVIELPNFNAMQLEVIEKYQGDGTP